MDMPVSVTLCVSLDFVTGWIQALNYKKLDK
jgi:hypothetical protein